MFFWVPGRSLIFWVLYVATQEFLLAHANLFLQLHLAPPASVPHCVSFGPSQWESVNLFFLWATVFAINNESQFHYTSSILLWSFWRPFQRRQTVASASVPPSLAHSWSSLDAASLRTKFLSRWRRRLAGATQQSTACIVALLVGRMCRRHWLPQQAAKQGTPWLAWKKGSLMDEHEFTVSRVSTFYGKVSTTQVSEKKTSCSAWNFGFFSCWNVWPRAHASELCQCPIKNWAGIDLFWRLVAKHKRCAAEHGTQVRK